MSNGNEQDDVVDFGEIVDQEAEKMIFEKNHQRTVALSELWLDTMVEKIVESDAPDDRKLEMMFVMSTNAILDLLMGSQPEEVSLLVAKNVDEYLRVALVNRRYGTDLMQSFQDEFFSKHGDDFETEEDLDRLLGTFDENWWNTKRDELEGLTPNKAVRKISEEYGI